ncbi:MAG: hypothetical protein HYR63_13980, partial [Proteobacteria bacterium]|nr:hypothetical protein [Pseudomonadota bacterium]
MLQLIPAGLLVTVPAPLPAIVTARVLVAAVRVAVQEALAFKVMTVEARAPEQAPLQPAKVDPAPGLAVSVTAVPWLNDAEQVPALQLMPAGLLVT